MAIGRMGFFGSIIDWTKNKKRVHWHCLIEKSKKKILSWNLAIGIYMWEGIPITVIDLKCVQLRDLMIKKKTKCFYLTHELIVSLDDYFIMKLWNVKIEQRFLFDWIQRKKRLEHA